MTLLDELAPEVDIDAALTNFWRIRDGRRRRRTIARLGAVTLAVAVLIGAALLVAHPTTHSYRRVNVAGPSTTTGTHGPRAWPSAHAAIDEYLRQYPHVRERARIRFDADNWILIAEGVPGFDRASVWTVGAVSFQRDASGWTQPGGGGAGMLDRCFQPLEAGDIPATGSHAKVKTGWSHPDYVYSVAADPRWQIQAFLNGRWATLPTTRGVYFKAHPSPPLVPTPGPPIQLRPVTADGRVPGCFAKR